MRNTASGVGAAGAERQFNWWREEEGAGRTGGEQSAGEQGSQGQEEATGVMGGERLSGFDEARKQARSTIRCYGARGQAGTDRPAWSAGGGSLPSRPRAAVTPPPASSPCYRCRPLRRRLRAASRGRVPGAAAPASALRRLTTFFSPQAGQVPAHPQAEHGG